METLLKQSLLLTHGTIYGTTAWAPDWYDFPDISASFDKLDGVEDWRAALYPVIFPVDMVSGSLTNNAPIDVVHWDVVGDLGVTGMEWWRQCMTLFMRHI